MLCCAALCALLCRRPSMAASYNICVACSAGDEVAVRRLLEASPAAALEQDALGCLPLHIATYNSFEALMHLLLEVAPQAAMAADDSGFLPLHWAALNGREAVVSLLLEAAQAAAMAADSGGWLPLHCAAFNGHAAVVRLLLEAAPQAATATAMGRTPLQLALDEGHTSTAFVLLGTGPAAAVLAALAAAGAPALALFPDFLLALGRLPLPAADWVLVPSPCPGIERALPAALACSAHQAAQVVRRLQPAEAARLRLAALCLHHYGLPGFVVALIVSRCV